MGLQVALDPEEAVAAATAVGLAAAVDALHVFLPVGKLGEAGVALGALEGPFARVPPGVELEGRRVGKGLPADEAPEGPLTRVGPLVHSELALLGESLSASCAPVGPVAGVGPHVLGQVSFEGLVADLADEGLDVLVQALEMLLQGVPAYEATPTNVALVVLLAVVTLEVEREVGRAGEGPRAKLATVGLNLAVGPSVLDQLAAPGEAFVALGALVRLVAGVGAQMEFQTLLQRKLLAALVAPEERSGRVDDLVVVS